MKYVFLTACRNEERILDVFVDEFTAMVQAGGLSGKTVLCVVDDLSTDESRAILARRAARSEAFELRVIPAPTNFGNQGAMFHGLRRIEVGDEDVLVTFDCDGEDDVRQIPSILELGAANAGKVVLIERGRRSESLAFRIFFAAYKGLFRALAGQRIVPNNFMLIPGSRVPACRRSPLAAVHLAYAVLKLNAPSVSTTRDRRPRYGGRSSQNLFALVSHGMVGLMVFYEVVVVKLFLLLFVFGAIAAAIVGIALAVPTGDVAIQRALLWSAIAAGLGATGFFALLFSAALAMMFKLTVFTLIQLYGDPGDLRDPRAGLTRPGASDPPARGAAPGETGDRRAR